MDVAFINVALAFFEGFALIISPCVWPILPIILAGSIAGNRSRPFGIIIGFVIAFMIVTLFSRALVAYAHLSSETIRNTSYVILLLLGVIMLSTYLTEKFTLLTSRLSNVGASMQTANNPQGGLISGVIFGALIGIVWTPCAGPILAAVIVQAIVQETTFGSVLVVAAFAIGAGIPMLLIAILGRRIMQRFHFFREHATLLRKLLGLIIIASVFLLIYSNSITLAIAQSNNTQSSSTRLTNGLEQPYPAPEITGIEEWINSPPLRLSDLKGKVVLIDFWTYSCINCIRTLPYVKDWYAKYHDKGLVVIGIHSPEFEFERDLDNVKTAVAKFGIHYPVALDNQFMTWRNFHNQYWPAHYLINKNGEVVYQHFGEGEYDATENNIRYLLGITTSVTQNKNEQDYSSMLTPKTYLGYGRATNFASPETVVHDQLSTYSYPQELTADHWALKGKWTIYPDKIISGDSGAAIKLHFNARQVYAVMGADKAIHAKVVIFTLPVPASGHKETSEQITILRNQLYTLVSLKQENEGMVELIAMSPGLEIYTFTFGS